MHYWYPGTIKAFRQRRAYTQADLARLTGYSLSTIKRAEAGGYRPRSLYLSRALSALEESSPDPPRRPKPSRGCMGRRPGAH